MTHINLPLKTKLSLRKAFRKNFTSKTHLDYINKKQMSNNQGFSKQLHMKAKHCTSPFKMQFNNENLAISC